MNAMKIAVILVGAAALLLLPGCASSPEAREKRANAEADIDEIVNYELDPTEHGPVKRCLSKTDFDNYRPLGDRHILFEGRRGKLWINTLRGRCSDLRHGEVLVVRQSIGSRMCEADKFSVGDWFDFRTGSQPSGWGTGPTCVLGEFRPITEGQVDEIEAVLESLER